MTNHRATADHNICGLRSIGSTRLSEARSVTSRHSERGYTLVALLAMMTVLALFAMAVAPSVQQQAVREREQEAIYRGEQVANAIKAYYRHRASTLRVVGDQALPTSMDQLLEGIPVVAGSKKRQILRPSAARDPLTIEGEWRLVLPRSNALIDFQQSIMFYTNNVLPPVSDPQMQQLQQFAVPTLQNVLNTGSTPSRPESSSVADDATGPFVGVASRRRRDSVLTFYGIERHDQWIFTPLFRW